MLIVTFQDIVTNLSVLLLVALFACVLLLLLFLLLCLLLLGKWQVQGE